MLVTNFDTKLASQILDELKKSCVSKESIAYQCLVELEKKISPHKKWLVELKNVSLRMISESSTRPTGSIIDPYHEILARIQAL